MEPESRNDAGDVPVLGRRELNRALLARQLLLRRHNKPILDTLEHLVGLQAQASRPPYFGLWSRLNDFDPHELGALLEDRRAVRQVLMRGTVHLVSPRDALELYPIVHVVMERFLQTRSGHKGVLDTLDAEPIVRAGAEAFAEGPLTAKELGERLHSRWPEYDGADLARIVLFSLPLLQVPPRGVWGRSGQPKLAPAGDWLAGAVPGKAAPGKTAPGDTRGDIPLIGEPIPVPAATGSAAPIDRLVLRYLAAFGPATVMDAQAWSGLTRLGPVLERLRPGLVTFRDTRGRELFDLPDAPRPEPETTAPVRYIAEFDNLTLSHADRGRIIDDRWRPKIASRNGMIPGMFLIDGFVAGTWKITKSRTTAALTVMPFERVSKRNVSALEAEGRRLLKFAAGELAIREVVFAAV